MFDLTVLSPSLCVSRSWRKPCHCRTWTSSGTSLLVCCRDATSAMTSRECTPKKINPCAEEINVISFQGLCVSWHPQQMDEIVCHG